jgi:hypothetical protein
VARPVEFIYTWPHKALRSPTARVTGQGPGVAGPAPAFPDADCADAGPTVTGPRAGRGAGRAISPKIFELCVLSGCVESRDWAPSWLTESRASRPNGLPQA